MAITLPAVYEFIAVQGNDVVIPLLSTLEDYMQPTSVVRLTVDGEAYDISGTQFAQFWNSENWGSSSVPAVGDLRGFRVHQDGDNDIIIYAGFDTDGTHSIQVDAIVKSTGNTTSSGVYKTALTFDSTSEEFSIVEYGTESPADLASHSEDVIILFDSTARGYYTGVGIPTRNSHDGWTCYFSYIVSIVGQGLTFRRVLLTESGFAEVDNKALSDNTQ